MLPADTEYKQYQFAGFGLEIPKDWKLQSEADPVQFISNDCQLTIRLFAKAKSRLSEDKLLEVSKVVLQTYQRSEVEINGAKSRILAIDEPALDKRGWAVSRFTGLQEDRGRRFVAVAVAGYLYLIGFYLESYLGDQETEDLAERLLSSLKISNE